MVRNNVLKKQTLSLESLAIWKAPRAEARTKLCASVECDLRGELRAGHLPGRLLARARERTGWESLTQAALRQHLRCTQLPAANPGTAETHPGSTCWHLAPGTAGARPLCSWSPHPLLGVEEGWPEKAVAAKRSSLGLLQPEAPAVTWEPPLSHYKILPKKQHCQDSVGASWQVEEWAQFPLKLQEPAPARILLWGSPASPPLPTSCPKRRHLTAVKQEPPHSWDILGCYCAQPSSPACTAWLPDSCWETQHKNPFVSRL